MKTRIRRVWTVLAALLVIFAYIERDGLAQRGNVWSTRAIKEFEQALTAGSIFGVPRNTTATLPTCNASNKGGIRWDTTTNSLKACDGSSWATPGASAASDNTWTGNQTFRDNKWAMTDDGDTSKILTFQLSGLSSATTRTITVPDASFTLAGLSVSNAFSADQILNDDKRLFFGTSSNAGIEYDTAQTPDALALGVDQASRILWIREQTDTADYALAQQTNPTLCLHSAATTANQYGCLAHDGSNLVFTTGTGQAEFTPSVRMGNGAVFVSSSNGDLTFGQNTSVMWQDGGSANAGTSIIGLHGQFKNLTESSATNVVQIPVASGSFVGGVLNYTVVASDGTDHQARSGTIQFQMVNKAGTETCTIATTRDQETEDGSSIAASAGTLTYTWTTDTTPSNACNLALNAVSSLSQTTLRIYYLVNVNGPGNPPVPQ